MWSWSRSRSAWETCVGRRRRRARPSSPPPLRVGSRPLGHRRAVQGAAAGRLGGRSAGQHQDVHCIRLSWRSATKRRRSSLRRGGRHVVPGETSAIRATDACVTPVPGEHEQRRATPLLRDGRGRRRGAGRHGGDVGGDKAIGNGRTRGQAYAYLLFCVPAGRPWPPGSLYVRAFPVLRTRGMSGSRSDADAEALGGTRPGGRCLSTLTHIPWSPVVAAGSCTTRPHYRGAESCASD